LEQVSLSFDSINEEIKKDFMRKLEWKIFSNAPNRLKILWEMRNSEFYKVCKREKERFLHV
jgi:hypothetical protein